MNIIISGWPGAGTTSISLLTAFLLRYRHIYAGGVMKYIAEKTIGVTSGPKYIEFEEQFGPKFDQIWEKYAKWKLVNSDRLLMEGKTTGFFVESNNIYEIMVIANVDARIDRAEFDKREDAAATIRARDFEVRQRWFSTFNIDIYNMHQIRENYDLVMDNSHMALEAELEFIVQGMLQDGRFRDIDVNNFPISYVDLAKLFWEKGKDYFREELMTTGLRINSEEVLMEWRDYFGEDLKALDINVDRLLS